MLAQANETYSTLARHRASLTIRQYASASEPASQYTSALDNQQYGSMQADQRNSELASQPARHRANLIGNQRASELAH
jgi:hypothetical protein